MFKILEAEQLSANVYKQVILAPRVAKSCEPGQFIILRVDEHGERIPLTICDYDREAGTVTIVFFGFKLAFPNHHRIPAHRCIY